MVYIPEFSRSTSLIWTSTNPILALNETGFETDTGKYKIGDGYSHWTDLSYFIPNEGLSGGGVGPPGPPGPQGPQGPIGLTGAAGATGPAGSSTTYIHNQITPLTVWTIAHGLGRFPSVEIVDSAGTVVVGDISYTDANTLVISFSAGFAGTAYLN